jgi:hypothetical protein
VKAVLALAAILVVCIFAGSYILATYHSVTYQRYYQITGKFWKDSSGFSHNEAPSMFSTPDEYWLHLKGHKDVEADSKNQWTSLSVGNYYLVEWTTIEKNIR